MNFQQRMAATAASNNQRMVQYAAPAAPAIIGEPYPVGYCGTNAPSRAYSAVQSSAVYFFNSNKTQYGSPMNIGTITEVTINSDRTLSFRNVNQLSSKYSWIRINNPLNIVCVVQVSDGNSFNEYEETNIRSGRDYTVPWDNKTSNGIRILLYGCNW